MMRTDNQSKQNLGYGDRRETKDKMCSRKWPCGCCKHGVGQLSYHTSNVRDGVARDTQNSKV